MADINASQFNEPMMTLAELDALLEQDKKDTPEKHEQKKARGEFDKFRNELIAKRISAGLDQKVEKNLEKKASQ